MHRTNASIVSPAILHRRATPRRAVEEIAGTVIACYLSRSDACNLSLTILIRTHIDIQLVTVVKWFIMTSVIRCLSQQNLTLQNVSSEESLNDVFTNRIVIQNYLSYTCDILQLHYWNLLEFNIILFVYWKFGTVINIIR